MSDNDELRKIIETNFRLSSLQMREVSAQVNGQMDGLDGRMTDVSKQITDIGRQITDISRQMTDISGQMTDISGKMTDISGKIKYVGQGVGELGRDFRRGMDKIADRNDETLSAVLKILDNSVDLHKTTADHEQRIRRLEDRAS